MILIAMLLGVGVGAMVTWCLPVRAGILRAPGRAVLYLAWANKAPAPDRELVFNLNGPTRSHTGAGRWSW